MPAGSVIVSGAESGDQPDHTDTSTAPHVLPPSDRSNSVRKTPFFLCADTKVQILMANCKNWKA